MKKDIARKLIDDIHQVPVFERHIRKCGYHLSDGFYISPISIWSKEIEVMVDIRRNVFKKALDKFVKQHEDVLRFAYFVCPQDCIPYLSFSVKQEYQS
jgi:hypothetical protein